MSFNLVKLLTFDTGLCYIKWAQVYFSFSTMNELIDFVKNRNSSPKRPSGYFNENIILSAKFVCIRHICTILLIQWKNYQMNYAEIDSDMRCRCWSLSRAIKSDSLK